MKKIPVVLGIINTLSPGLTANEKETFYQSCLKPVLTLLYNRPEIRITQFYSGFLLEWLETSHPEFLMVLSEMVKRKQVEVLGNAFYEPLLPLLAGHDRIGQIEMMTTYLRKTFGKRPRGYWLNGQIWDPNLVSTLKSCGMEYTFLTDDYLRLAGVPEASLNRVYLTEEQSKLINILPMNRVLQDSFLDREPQGFFDEMERLSQDPMTQLISFFLPVESLCAVQSRSHNQSRGSHLFDFLERSDNLRLYCPSQWMKTAHIAPDKLYPPPASYEMVIRHLHPGFPLKNGTRSYRHILNHYPETNMIYSKIMYIHIQTNLVRGDKSRKKSSKEYLWRGESLYGFIETKGGGIFNLQNRKESYRALIEAEKMTRERGTFKAGINVTDFDNDGKNEYLYQGSNINAYIHRRGGSLFELDYLPDLENLTNTFFAKSDIVEDAGGNIITTNNVFDRYRFSFTDHFFNDNQRISSFGQIYTEDIGDFYKQWYSVEGLSKENSWLALQQTSQLNGERGNRKITLKKKYLFKRNSIEIYYTILSHSIENDCFQFAPELLFTLSDLRDEYNISTFGPDIKTVDLLDFSGQNQTDSFVIENRNMKTDIHFQFNEAVDVVCMPFFLSPDNLLHKETYYQQHVFLPVWKINLKAKSKYQFSINLRINKHKTTVKELVER